MLWLIAIVVLVVLIVVFVLASATGGTEDGPNPPSDAHRQEGPSPRDLDRALEDESSFARSNVYVFATLAEEAYEGPMRNRGFDIEELEHYVDRVCSRLVELGEQDPELVVGQIGEWVELTRQTAQRNGYSLSEAFRTAWDQPAHSFDLERGRRDALELTTLRYLESDRVDRDGLDLRDNLSSLLPYAIGIGEGFLIPQQVRDDISQLGPVGVYERIERAGLAVGDHGRGPRTPLFFTEILGNAWNMRSHAGRDTVADHGSRVLAAMDGHPAEDLRAPGGSFYRACEEAATGDGGP